MVHLAFLIEHNLEQNMENGQEHESSWFHNLPESSQVNLAVEIGLRKEQAEEKGDKKDNEEYFVLPFQILQINDLHCINNS